MKVCQSWTANKIFLRSTISAIAPAGKVNNVYGSAETVAISEIMTVDAPSEFSAQ